MSGAESAGISPVAEVPLRPQFVEHRGIDTGVRHARDSCRPPSGERRAGCPVILAGASSAAYRADPCVPGVVGVPLGPVADYHGAGTCCGQSFMLSEGFPHGRAVLPAPVADPGCLAWSADNVVRRGEPDRHRGDHVPVDAQLSPDQVLGPGVPRAHLDGKDADVSGIIIGHGWRRAEVAVEGTLPAIVMQGIEQAFRPAYQAAHSVQARLRGR